MFCIIVENLAVSSSSSSSLTSPTAVYRYITQFSKGTAVKQAMFVPVVKVPTSEHAVNIERTAPKTTPSISVLSNGSSFVTNGRSLQQQTFIGATNLPQLQHVRQVSFITTSVMVWTQIY